MLFVYIPLTCISAEKKMTDEPRKNIIPLLFLLMLGLALYVDLSGQYRRMRKGEMVGKPVANFDIPELGKPGSHFSPKAWEGKVVIVNIFASWCEPCRAEYPLLMKLSQSINVPMYGIAWKDNERNLQAMLKHEGNPYAMIAVDQDGSKVTRPFGIRGLPSTYIIDKNGIVAYHYLSALDEAEIKHALRPILEELTAAPATASGNASPYQ
jgi:cytochrome c biogenesis protein CcmG, thiol:disulfide interchange protein DsbE